MQLSYFEMVFGFKVTQQSWLLLFAFSSLLLLLFFASHASFFFSCWAFNLVGVILVGKVREAFRILGLDESKSTCLHVYVGG